ncbi:MAG TPA: type II secretion system protein GspD [Candidatus Binatia bacterium]|nr:type II secretion system protein GspD [Candidatus Binatia bacterium]
MKTTSQATAALTLLVLSFTGCQHPKSPPPKPPPEISYNETYDAEIKEILELAKQNRWEEARAKALALYQKDPKNPIVGRVRTWVEQQTQERREQALEDKIREIDTKNSAFNPTLGSLLKEQKDRGLPARKDVRDAVSRIENAPYIPESYGKTLHEEGPLFDLESSKGRMAKVLEKEVSIHLDNVPLETILVNLSQSAGVNIVADKSVPALKQTLGVNLDKVKLGEFLRYISRNYDLQFQVGDELVWVVDAKDPKKLMEETRFYRLRKGFVLPAQFGTEDVNRQTVTANNVSTTTENTKYRKFVNDEAPTAPALEKAIKELYTGSKYMIDYERNLVVARGTPEQLDVMEKIIQEFDQPIQQVLIEARFVTISKPAFLQLGVLWETARQNATAVPQDFTGILNSQNFPTAINAFGSVNPAVGLGIQHTFANVFGANDLSATISAMEQSGESQTLSAPRLTVLNNRPASISDGKVQYYYEEYAVKSTVQQYYTSSSFVPSGKPTKITAGAELNVMASISGDGKSILLALNPRVNTDVQLVKYATVTDFDASGNKQDTFDINLPQYRTQELATRVVVKSGETVVMGGVLERERSTFVEAVPVLGNLPLVGTLFRRRTEVDTPRYLLVFVTATIVKNTGEYLVYDERTSSTNSVTAPK